MRPEHEASRPRPRPVAGSDWTRRAPAGFRRCVCALLLTAYLSACSSWQVPATSPQRLIADDRPSRIRVTLEDQSQVELYEPSMVGDTLRGFLEKAGSGPASARGRRDILMAHVTALEIRSADAGKTALLGLGLAAGALVAVVVVHDFLICDGLSC